MFLVVKGGSMGINYINNLGYIKALFIAFYLISFLYCFSMNMVTGVFFNGFSHYLSPVFSL